MSAVVRCNDPQPPTLYLNPLPGVQYAATLRAAPVDRPPLEVPSMIIIIARGGCGLHRQRSRAGFICNGDRGV